MHKKGLRPKLGSLKGCFTNNLPVWVTCGNALANIFHSSTGLYKDYRQCLQEKCPKSYHKPTISCDYYVLSMVVFSFRKVLRPIPTTLEERTDQLVSKTVRGVDPDPIIFGLPYPDPTYNSGYTK